MLPFSDCFKESHEIENDEHTMSYQIHKRRLNTIQVLKTFHFSRT